MHVRPGQSSNASSSSSSSSSEMLTVTLESLESSASMANDEYIRCLIAADAAEIELKKSKAKVEIARENKERTADELKRFSSTFSSSLLAGSKKRSLDAASGEPNSKRSKSRENKEPVTQSDNVDPLSYQSSSSENAYPESGLQHSPLAGILRPFSPDPSPFSTGLTNLNVGGAGTSAESSSRLSPPVDLNLTPSDHFLSLETPKSHSGITSLDSLASISSESPKTEIEAAIEVKPELNSEGKSKAAYRAVLAASDETEPDSEVESEAEAETEEEAEAETEEEAEAEVEAESEQEVESEAESEQEVESEAESEEKSESEPEIELTTKPASATKLETLTVPSAASSSSSSYYSVKAPDILFSFDQSTGRATQCVVFLSDRSLDEKSHARAKVLEMSVSVSDLEVPSKRIVESGEEISLLDDDGNFKNFVTQSDYFQKPPTEVTITARDRVTHKAKNVYVTHTIEGRHNLRTSTTDEYFLHINAIQTIPTQDVRGATYRRAGAHFSAPNFSCDEWTLKAVSPKASKTSSSSSSSLSSNPNAQFGTPRNSDKYVRHKAEFKLSRESFSPACESDYIIKFKTLGLELCKGEEYKNENYKSVVIERIPDVGFGGFLLDDKKIDKTTPLEQKLIAEVVGEVTENSEDPFAYFREDGTIISSSKKGNFTRFFNSVAPEDKQKANCEFIEVKRVEMSENAGKRYPIVITKIYIALKEGEHKKGDQCLVCYDNKYQWKSAPQKLLPRKDSLYSLMGDRAQQEAQRMSDRRLTRAMSINSL